MRFRGRLRTWVGAVVWITGASLAAGGEGHPDQASPKLQRHPPSNQALHRGRAPREERSGSCAREGARPSPVDVVPRLAVPADGSIRLHYGLWNRSAVTVTRLHGSDSFRLDFKGMGGGSIQVGSRFDDLDEYVLRSVIVRTPSEHSFLGRRMPMEAQLMHEPIMQHELEMLQDERKKAHSELDALHKEAKLWAAKIRQLQDSAETPNRTFPDLQTLNDWVKVTRADVNAHGKRISEKAWAIRKLMAAMDAKMEQLVATLRRPGSTRVIGLSVFFKASDEESPPQMQASTFVRWLDTAARETEERNLSADPMVSGVPELFDFAKMPYQGTKDLGGGIFHRVYTYEGRFTRPPCTPVVQWFVASEPLVAFSVNLVQLINRTHFSGGAVDNKSKADCQSTVCELGLGGDVWWDGDLRDAEGLTPALDQPSELFSVFLSTDPFVAPAEGVGHSTLASMSWSYVNSYCLVFLVFSILMLCFTCTMWTQKCCDQ